MLAGAYLAPRCCVRSAALPRRSRASLASAPKRHKMAAVMATTPSAQYSLILRVEIDHLPGMLGKVASAIGEAGGTIGAIDLVQVEGPHTIRDITVETGDAADWPRLTDAVNKVPGVRVLDTTD